MVASFDINEAANDVYEHNFGRRTKQINIEAVPAAQLDRYKADCWLLSPPCQPYTRRGLGRHSRDGRASSFLALLGKLKALAHPPRYLLVENVVGFERSDTREELVRTLRECGFATQEWLASPADLGVPYARPRYFLLARMGHDACFALEAGADGLLRGVPVPCAEEAGAGGREWAVSRHDALRLEQRTLAEYLEPRPEAEFEAATSESSRSAPPMLLLSADTLHKHGWALDVVTPRHARSCCFTKTYGQYLKNSGSVVTLADSARVADLFARFPLLLPRSETRARPQQGGEKAAAEELGEAGDGTARPSLAEPADKAQLRAQVAEALAPLRSRFFAPREIANLHGFPASFCFPAETSLKQRHAMLGNSLSVDVVSHLLVYLFSR